MLFLKHKILPRQNSFSKGWDDSVGWIL